MIANLKRVTKDTRMSFIIMQAENIDNLICAEVGVYRGFNAIDMLNIDRTMKLHLIDSYVNIGKTDVYGQVLCPDEAGWDGLGNPDDCKAEARDNLRFYLDHITFVYKQSEEAYKDYPDGYFDYVYIDGDHAYKSVKRDIELWYPKVKKGGILGGHDVGMPSVGKAVTEFIHDNNIINGGSLYIEAKESDWWIFKV